jgi:hypothetical protein
LHQQIDCHAGHTVLMILFRSLCLQTHCLKCRAPDNPKTYLRAAQARLGLGPGEYDGAASLLNQALAKAKEQDAPTKGGGNGTNL